MTLSYSNLLRFLLPVIVTLRLRSELTLDCQLLGMLLRVRLWGRRVCRLGLSVERSVSSVVSVASASEASLAHHRHQVGHH